MTNRVVSSAGIFLLATGFCLSQTKQLEQASRTPQFAVHAEQVIKALGSDRFSDVETRFDSYLSGALPVEKLSSEWRQFLDSSGPFIGVKASHEDQEPGDYHVVTLVCKFQHAPNNVALVTFDRTNHIAGLYFGPQPTSHVDQWEAPNYVTLNEFHEEPKTVIDGPWHLPATLTVPNGRGPFPAVVLVPGSPPLDQDATVGSSKLFKDLAWGLASRGVVVLRYTKRTHMYGAGLGSGFSSFSVKGELIDDAHAAFTLLTKQKVVDQGKIYLFGHSMGGEVAPKIAEAEPKLAGVITMGSASERLTSVLLQRTKDRVELGGDEGKQAAELLPIFRDLNDGSLPAGKVVTIFGQRIPVSYYTELGTYGTGAAMAQLKIPVLILLGGHDAEIPSNALAEWKSALTGDKSATIKFYPNLFHLFMPSTATRPGWDTPDDWGRPGHIAPQVVDDTAAWILSMN